VDGLRGDSGMRELDKYKERGEEACRPAATWWAEVAKDLEGEIAAVQTRLEAAGRDEQRLTGETQKLREQYEKSGESHDEMRLREAERKLDFSRREQKDLHDRLDRTRALRKNGYVLGRTSAEEFRDYFEGLMRSYCAGNKKSPPNMDTLPVINLPASLEKEDIDDGVTQPAPSAPAPAPPAPSKAAASRQRATKPE